MAVGIDCDGESYGLVIDSVGEVLKLRDDSREPVPVNLDAAARARRGLRASPGSGASRGSRCRAAARHEAGGEDGESRVTDLFCAYRRNVPPSE